jgi:colanic acid/amylovoran biosynthesis protein
MSESYCVFGAAGDTWNLGVSALMESIVLGLHHHRPDAALTVFDNGFGARSGIVRVADREVQVALIGARHSRRLYRSDTLRTMQAAAALGGIGNPGVSAIRAATAVLDVSGGDSFTDLYGGQRLRQVVLPKQIVLGQGRPLVLMPQTYGPFRSQRARRQAQRIVRRAHQAWARDPRAYERLMELAGADFDPKRHRCGVDVAFGLPSSPLSSDDLPNPIGCWLSPERPGPVVGLNVSGLVYLGGEAAERQYGLRVDYRDLIHGLVDLLLTRTDARIVLVPHVVAPVGHPQSDMEASQAVLDRIDDSHRRRVAMAPPPVSASAAKGIISSVDWFCGTRMHATIAALSSGVPTGGIAYSIKMAGVFATCGQEDNVVDATSVDTGEAVDRLWWSWQQRERTAAELPAGRDEVVALARRQLDEILASVQPAANTPSAS